MKKVLVSILLLFCFLFGTIITFADQIYYVRKDNEYETEFLCNLKGECLNIRPNKLKIENRRFWAFGGYYYWDIDSYKYDRKNDIYSVDVAFDRDPSTDLGYYSKCPFDKGDIIYIIFNFQYSPSHKTFNAKYKGIISAEEVVERNSNGDIEGIYFNNYKVYYNTSPNLIEELGHYNDYFKNLINEFGKNGVDYDKEMTIVIPRFI